MFLLKLLQFFELSKFIPEISNLETRRRKRKILHTGTADITVPKSLLVAFPFSRMSAFSHHHQLHFSKQNVRAYFYEDIEVFKAIIMSGLLLENLCKSFAIL